MQSVVVAGALLLSIGVIAGLVAWLSRLTACDPFDPSERC